MLEGNHKELQGQPLKGAGETPRPERGMGRPPRSDLHRAGRHQAKITRTNVSSISGPTLRPGVYTSLYTSDVEPSRCNRPIARDDARCQAARSKPVMDGASPQGRGGTPPSCQVTREFFLTPPPLPGFYRFWRPVPWDSVLQERKKKPWQETQIPFQPCDGPHKLLLSPHPPLHR